MEVNLAEREFFDFIYNRQLIWHKRFILREKFPWTDDLVLQKYKILNVYRELDKGTIYILNKLKNVSDRRAILLNVVFYRFFNRYGLYEKLGINPFSDFSEELVEGLKSKLKEIRKNGKPIFSDAYLIAGKSGEEKYVSVINAISYLNNHIDDFLQTLNEAPSPEVSYNALKSIPLVGGFLAYEIWTDLTYFDFFKRGWSDDDFVNIGPGAKWGLEIIYGKSGLEKIRKLHKIQSDFLLAKKSPSWSEIAYEGAFSNRPFLSLRNIEHALCEFRKYYNLSHGRGKRRLFTPSSQS